MRWLRAAFLLLGAGLAACAAQTPVPESGLRFTPLDFSQLQGWASDDQAAAFDAFRRTCGKGRTGAPELGVTEEDWAAVCAEAGMIPRSLARQFFETRFHPVLVTDADSPAEFTAYYEPVLHGSRLPIGPYQYPILARPPDLPDDGSYYWTRAQIDQGALDGMGLELFWLDDPVDAFYLQIQGSGRIRTEDGEVHRVGFAGKNGHPYVSVGKMMIADGVLTPGQASAEGIKAWVQAHPQQGRAYLDRNPSYVFFRELPDLDHGLGPIGAMGEPLTPWRSVAVDASIYPLGAPVWVEAVTPRGPVRSLMIAQDTGSAIKGAERADLFLGTGDEAGAIAGNTHSSGRMVVLVPGEATLRVASGG